mmetsp:Transcript_21099/g.61587  ORF Transcript_21099/g.61587 Transcript_21099/m.61587 type:complete len:586 (-) Transcript_21099:113-1870(-)|eukprot:CAMPEP_0118982942 /NCGR_PEP_ID=MMETSP1173-20130426/34157_1 /TAXON_ID=1034831 /ORGANISM="Rhizochromulina marina cf, Strain CCMP1243" /LENGTH=585 /DNA_ID=CAMNT_0006933479 /DNA_START=1 /DNA_END=1758 /DNA_ORIENTATION=-
MDEALDEAASPPMSDGEFLSDGELLSDGEQLEGGDQIPPRHKRYLRAVRRTVEKTLQELGSLELEGIGESLRNQIQRQQEGLAKLLRRPGGTSSEESTRLREVLNERHRNFRAQLVAVDQRVRSAQRRMRNRVRKVISGDPGHGVREFLANQRKKPTIVRLLDKFAFLYGVLSLVGSEYILLEYPSYFWLWYSCFMTALIAARVPEYRFKKWTYFMLDFCYYANLCNVLNVVFFPASCTFFKINFSFSLGPLCWAVVLWRNSLVFHAMDKVTTVYIHILPSWLVLVTRWYLSSTDGRLSGLTECPAYSLWDFLATLACYCLWQTLYFVKTEVLDSHILDADPSLQTSLRWLSLDTERGINKLVLSIMRWTGAMRKNETFDPSSVKTKFIFMASQLVYTALTLVVVPFLYRSYTLCITYVIFIFCVSVYNGGEYYIEVFSRRYYQQFDKSEAASAREVVRDDFEDPPPGPTTTTTKGNGVSEQGGCSAKPGGGTGNGHVSQAARNAMERMLRETGPLSIQEPPPIVSDDEDMLSVDGGSDMELEYCDEVLLRETKGGSRKGPSSPSSSLLRQRTAPARTAAAETES